MLPAAALLAVLCWNFLQWRDMAEQRETSGHLIHRLKTGKWLDNGSGTDIRRPDGHSSLDHVAGSKNHLDGRPDDSNGARGPAIQKRMDAMSVEEIIAALDDTSGMRSGDEESRLLEERLLGRLVDLDPELALAKFAHRISEGSAQINSHLARALRSWAGKNPKSATSWLNQQLEAGLFDASSLDGMDGPRLEFEAALVGALLMSDPSAAGSRIAALPEDQRRLVFESIGFDGLSDAARTSYAELVRELVPKDETAGSLAHIVSKLATGGGFEGVDLFLDRIQASADERRICARQAADSQLAAIATERALTHGDVDAMRVWLETQSPDNVESITGHALAEVVQDNARFGFETASAMVLEYHRRSGNDDVLVSFLRGFAARSNLQQAASLIPMIKDPAVRQTFLDRLN